MTSRHEQALAAADRHRTALMHDRGHDATTAEIIEMYLRVLHRPTPQPRLVTYNRHAVRLPDSMPREICESV